MYTVQHLYSQNHAYSPTFIVKTIYTAQHLYSQNHVYSTTIIQSHQVQHNIHSQNHVTTKIHNNMYFKLYIACSTEKYVLVPDMKWLRT
jgi:hypothetical protein